MAVFATALDMSGQLSPGPLTNAHAHLEGMSNCTQCHDIGQRVPNSKCLACHEEIQDLLDADRGYHSHSTVRNQDCIDCHSEHHGKKFDMTRFDTDNFDHALTGYELEGEHAKTDCRECHKADNIPDPDIRKLKDTYLGLQDDCLSCHNDYHQASLSKQCVNCHNFNAFVPASLFDHDNADYKLRGEHQELECISCHAKEIRNGNEFQVFTGIEFGDCIACHEDPHGGLPGRCSSCHTEESFDLFTGLKRFDHDLTDFNLKGRHRSTSCFECHERNRGARDVFADKSGVSEKDCVQCHEDVHDTKFGLDCAECHNEKSFHELNAGMEFNHHLTDFPLLGMHDGLDCALCHTESYTVELAHENCIDCHEDYHEGEFTASDPTVDCDDCHTVIEGFSFTSFGFDDHANTEFPLEGSHLATPCFACHLSEDHWQFRNIGSQCIDCHDDIHKDKISEKYYPEQDCSYCHNPNTWTEVDFDHDLTEWPLEDKHAEAACRNCHFKDDVEPRVQSFINLSMECYTCHEDVHQGQFELGGITDCERCHITVNWSENVFDHSGTEFPLEGKHAELECVECHSRYDGEVLIFKIEKFECIDCHS